VPDIRFGMRSGFTLVGEDEEGIGFTWHIDGAADLFLTLRAAEDCKKLADPELLVIVNGEGATVLAEHIALYRTPSVRADRTSLLQVIDTKVSGNGRRESGSPMHALLGHRCGGRAVYLVCRGGGDSLVLRFREPRTTQVTSISWSERDTRSWSEVVVK
jgi:hypothetical protein